MNLDEIRAAWQLDCEIDQNDLGLAAAKSPNLHAKYLDELIQYKLRLTKLQNEIIEYRAKRTRYYKGEMTREELTVAGWDQWQYKTLKSEIDSVIDAEPHFQKLATREQYIRAVIYYLESVLQEIKARSFHVKAIVEWQRFRAGA
jgi:hypothetical protein